MSLDDFIILVCAVAGVICFVGYRYCCENVYLKYKEQKVGVRTKRWRGSK